MNTDLIAYYKDRAKEYERIYSKSERQADLQTAASILQDLFSGKEVLEIACGTGYWTEKIATTANEILATDINESVLEIARQKTYSNAKVQFGQADIFNFKPEKQYESLFGGFIWSHIPLQELDGFLGKVLELVQPGGMLVFMDNNFVEGSNHPVTETDEYGNTFQTRKLEDGSSHLVLKNFPSQDFLRQKLAGIATELEFVNLDYYWILSCRTVR